MKKYRKPLLITAAALLALLLVPLLALRAVTSRPVANALLGKFVPEYLYARSSVSGIRWSLLSSWPQARVEIDSLLLLSAVSEPADTLFFAPRLAVKANVWQYLAHGTVHVCEAVIDQPCIKAARTDSTANWDIVRPSEPDTSGGDALIPPLFIGDARINGARLSYTATDSLSAQSLRVNGLSLKANGTYTPDSARALALLRIDSVRLEDPAIQRHYKVDGFTLTARAAQNEGILRALLEAGTPAVTLNDSLLDLHDRRLRILAEAASDHDFTHLDIDRLEASLDSMSLRAGGALERRPDSAWYTDLNATLDIPHMSQLLKLTPKPFSHYLKGARFDGALAAEATAKGEYKGARYPVLTARVDLQGLHGHFDGHPQRMERLDLQADARYDCQHKDSTYARLSKLYFKIGPSHLNANGLAKYRTGREYVEAMAKGHLDLGDLAGFYPAGNLTLRGTLDPDLNAWLYLDDLANRRLDRVYSKTVIKGDDLTLRLPGQNIDLWVDSLTARLNTNTGHTSRRNLTDTALVNIRVRFDALTLRYKNQLRANARKFSASFMADDIKPAATPKLRVSVSARGLDAAMRDTSLQAKRLRTSFRINPHPEHPFVPRSSVRFSADSTTARAGALTAFLDSTRIEFAATPNYRKRRKNAEGKRVLIPDSLQPTMDFKALVDTVISVSRAEQPVETYIRRFRNEGDIYVRAFRLRGGHFPLQAAANQVDVKFTDDTLHLNNFQLKIGSSTVYLNGEVNNMRRWALPSRRKKSKLDRTLHADLHLKSNFLDANQLVRALYAMNESEADETATAAAPVTVSADSTASDSTANASLIVIPDHLDLKFNANVNRLRIAKVDLKRFQGEVTLKDHTLRVKQLSTSTRLGDAAANVMYHCENSKTANAAATIDMDDIQIGELVDALPALDTIMPMLRSFKGSVFCEASATCDIDSAMNVVLPSVNAGAYLQGRDLVLLDGETFSEIAKILMFSKKTENLIDSISVEMMVENNEIQIFPFMLSMDKYRVGVGGQQGLDMSFNYHIALLRSPLLLKIGVDVYGTDFDHIKFRIGSPKFKDSNVRIGRGGTLLRQEDANLRDNFQKMVEKTILQY